MENVILQLFDFFGLSSDIPTTFPELFQWFLMVCLSFGLVKFVISLIIDLVRSINKTL